MFRRGVLVDVNINFEWLPTVAMFCLIEGCFGSIDER